MDKPLCVPIETFQKSTTETEEENDLCRNKQYCVAVCANLGLVLIGYMLCWSAPMTVKLQDSESSPLPQLISDQQASGIASVITIGLVIGAQLSAYSANRFGRKKTLILFGVAILVGNILLLVAKSLHMILIGRIMSGLGGGGTSVTALVYISEIASPNIRGIMLTSTAVLHTSGCLLVYAVAPFVTYSAVGYLAVGISSLYVLGGFSIVESPVYYRIKGKEDKARAILRKLGRHNELNVIIENTKEQKLMYTLLSDDKTKVKWVWLEIFNFKRNRRAFVITTTLFAIQDAGGIICVMFFATSIFQKAASSVQPHLATIILGLTQLFGVILTPLLVERFGRRSLLLISTLLCAICMGMLGTHFYLEMIKHELLESTRWVPLVVLMLFLFFFNAGLGVIPNVLVGEMFSPNVRSTGSSIAMCLGWLAGFASGFSFGYIVYFGSHIVFIICAIINFAGFIFTLMFVPETKGKSLTEIEEMMSR